MISNDLLNLCLNFRRDVTSRDLFKQRDLSRRQMLTELSLPFGDLVDRDRIQLQSMSASGSKSHKWGTYKTVDTSVDDRDLNLHSKRLVLTLLE
jgi:hypothetical protein